MFVIKSKLTKFSQTYTMGSIIKQAQVLHLYIKWGNDKITCLYTIDINNEAVVILTCIHVSGLHADYSPAND